MKKIIEKIIKAMEEITANHSVTNDTALQILIAAAGGVENVPCFLCDENDRNCNTCGGEEDEEEECHCHEYDDEEEEDEKDYDDEELVDTAQATVLAGNRVTIPKHIVQSAEKIQGRLDTNAYGGKFIVARYPNEIDIFFGDDLDEYAFDDSVRATVNMLNSRGQMQIGCVPTFTQGDKVDISVDTDGIITIC